MKSALGERGCFFTQNSPFHALLYLLCGLENSGIKRRGKHVFVTDAADRGLACFGQKIAALGLRLARVALIPGALVMSSRRSTFRVCRHSVVNERMLFVNESASPEGHFQRNQRLEFAFGIHLVWARHSGCLEGGFWRTTGRARGREKGWSVFPERPGNGSTLRNM
jgi:hypothetical protein